MGISSSSTAAAAPAPLGMLVAPRTTSLRMAMGLGHDPEKYVAVFRKDLAIKRPKRPPGGSRLDEIPLRFNPYAYRVG